MKAIIQPSQLKGIIHSPPSKSSMQRACAAALLRTGRSVISNYGISADDKAAVSIIQQLGAKLDLSATEMTVDSEGVRPVGKAIDAGESGLSARLFTSLAAISSEEIIINGKGSLLKRPFHFFDEVMPLLGVFCQSNKGCLPIRIRGPLQPAPISIDGSVSSQFLSGLLMAYAALNAKDVTIRVKDLSSKPYIDLTLDVMGKFGFPVPQNNSYESFHFPATVKNNFPGTINYKVEGDWSGASFFLVAGAIAGEIIVEGLDVFSTQADRAILQPLMQTGAGMSIEENKITVRAARLQAFHFNATDCPDLFPPLVALAVFCQGTSVIEGVHRLQFKESNRAQSLREEMGKMGVEITFQDDMMLVRGGQSIQPAEVNSHGDHRIAMACAIVATGAGGEVTIENAEAVEKSYPSFFDDLRSLGAGVSLENI